MSYKRAMQQQQLHAAAGKVTSDDAPIRIPTRCQGMANRLRCICQVQRGDVADNALVVVHANVLLRLLLPKIFQV
jgi:hypothetical protein